MTFLELARSRCSVRAFSGPPTEAELEQVLEAGRLAPSACNRQPWSFVVIKDPARLKALGEAYPRDWFAAAPAVVALCRESSRQWVRPQDGKPHGDIDVAIAADHMTLCAAELGLGTCWVCHFDPVKAREALGVPEGVEPVVLLPIGRPAGSGRPKDRLAREALVYRERYGNR